jgi:Protein of unknown function (DUF2922)
MAKTLQLVFLTDKGKTHTMTIYEPKENIESEINVFMGQVIDLKAINGKNGMVNGIKGAQYIDKNVFPVNLA